MVIKPCQERHQIPIIGVRRFENKNEDNWFDHDREICLTDGK